MSAPEHNKFWKARSSHGRKPKFDDPEQLWGAACEYFEWADNNPLLEYKPMQSNGEIVMEAIPKMRAMTESGLCLYLDICNQTWQNYKAKQGFLEVSSAIINVIRDQKFTGASAGLLNASIIARDLGLKEATQNEISGPDGTPIKVQEIIFNPVGNEYTSKD